MLSLFAVHWFPATWFSVFTGSCHGDRHGYFNFVGTANNTSQFFAGNLNRGGEPPEGPTGNPVPGDITGDHNVTIEDVYVLAVHWADPNCNDATDCGGSDLDGSGNTNNADFRVLSANWQKQTGF
jgi:hypothetical protein